MDADEARALTDEVREDAVALWMKLLRLYEGRAHEALGYGNWADYYRAEFGKGKAHAYRLLSAARVYQEVGLHVETRGATEAQMRSLAAMDSEIRHGVAVRVDELGGWARVSVREMKEIGWREAGLKHGRPGGTRVRAERATRLSLLLRELDRASRTIEREPDLIYDLAGGMTPDRASKAAEGVDEHLRQLVFVRDVMRARAGDRPALDEASQTGETGSCS